MGVHDAEGTGVIGTDTEGTDGVGARADSDAVSLSTSSTRVIVDDLEGEDEGVRYDGGYKVCSATL